MCPRTYPKPPFLAVHRGWKKNNQILAALKVTLSAHFVCKTDCFWCCDFLILWQLKKDPHFIIIRCFRCTHPRADIRCFFSYGKYLYLHIQGTLLLMIFQKRREICVLVPNPGWYVSSFRLVIPKTIFGDHLTGLWWANGCNGGSFPY